jgi:hypothetical protein
LEFRNHYNCSTLNGVELEDYGGGGTAGAHWEQRVMDLLQFLEFEVSDLCLLLRWLEMSTWVAL